jgi:alpha-L-rhamnosidase
MKKSYFLFLLLILSISSFAQITVQHLLLENKINPIGIDVIMPRFSWQIISDNRNVMQSAYEIRVSDNMLSLTKNKDVIWSTGKISSDSSVHVAYKGKALQPGKKYYWQVRVWNNKGKASAWSATAFWQMGLLNKDNWNAKWITPGYPEDRVNRPSPLFRKEFLSDKKIISATAYITAHGLYEAEINGKRIGEAYLTPGWTSYKNRLQYQVYDVTPLLKKGVNAIGVTLGNGWYRGIIGFGNNINVYGSDIALLFQMNIKYSDGSTDSVISNESWKSSTGAIRYAEIYNGEIIDARKEKT